MSEIDANGRRSAFIRPSETGWRHLSVAPDSSEDEIRSIRSNQDELHNTLLASLQMQHLVVLAGSGCSLSAGGPSMGDLWNAVVGTPSTSTARKAATKVGYDLVNGNIEALLSRIEAFQQLKEDVDLTTFLTDSKNIILRECSVFLNTEALESHRTFLHRLSRRRVRDQRLKIFTTNYDLCFEHAAGTLGGVVLDGFSFAAPRQYDPRFFSYDIVRRPHGGDDIGNYLEGVFLLYKLHGSVNWARKADGTIYEEKEPRPEEACLIYPASGKYQQSYTQPHLESMAQYLAAVREPNTCLLVTGFGFNDDHLAEPLLAAAASNPHLRIIIIDPNAEARVSDGNRYWRKFTELSRQGEDIWFIEADFKVFAQMIPDLKSLTPADKLMKAIQGITRER